MQRLIDADKAMKMIEKAKVSDEKSRNFAENIIRFSETVLTIPENPTNGQMIMAMFPDVSVTEIGGGSTIVVNHDLKFNITWWNLPYKGVAYDRQDG